MDIKIYCNECETELRIIENPKNSTIRINPCVKCINANIEYQNYQVRELRRKLETKVNTNE